MGVDRGPYRSVYCVLLNSPEFRSLSRDAKNLLTTLMLTDMANMAHIFVCDEGGLLTLSRQSGIPSRTLPKALRELSETHWAYHQDDIIWVRNGLRFDPGISLANENHKKGVLNILKSLPKSEIIARFCKYYALDMPSECHSNGPPRGIETPSIPLRNKEEGIRKKEEGTGSNISSQPKTLEDYKPEIQTIVNRFSELILENKPDRKNPDPKSEQWKTGTADAIDKMERLDKRKLPDIAAVIEACQADNVPRGKTKFCWAPNILSGNRLREKFDRLQDDLKAGIIGIKDDGNETVASFHGKDGQRAL